MLYVLIEAMEMYRLDRVSWDALVKKIMNIDFSWNVSAEKYLELYSGVTGSNDRADK